MVAMKSKRQLPVKTKKSQFNLNANVYLNKDILFLKYFTKRSLFIFKINQSIIQSFNH